MFQDCDIYANEDVGFAVLERGNPTVTQCKIHDGKSVGVFVWQDGQGMFSECDIYRNTKSGIQVKEFGNPFVTGCRIHNGKDCGVFILENGMGTFNNNKLSKNIHCDWNIADDAGKVSGYGNKPKMPKSFWKSIFG